MPIRVTLRGFLLFGFVNVIGAFEALQQTVFAAVGRHPTGHLGWRPGWEAMLYPPSESSAAARRSSARWAQCMLLGHALFAAACVSRGVYLAPFLLSCGPFFNGWLFFLCNSTQHVGLEPSVPDFRRNTRTFRLHPALAFLYWHMNWHIEHHMWPRVPCYNLAALHEAIKHDLPPTPDGLFAVWRVVAADMRALEKDPAFVERVALPKAAAPAAGNKRGVAADKEE
jgi:fatty acid desaturase